MTSSGQAAHVNNTPARELRQKRREIFYTCRRDHRQGAGNYQASPAKGLASGEPSDGASKDPRGGTRHSLPRRMLLYVFRRRKPQIQEADTLAGGPPYFHASSHVHAQESVRLDGKQ